MTVPGSHGGQLWGNFYQVIRLLSRKSDNKYLSVSVSVSHDQLPQKGAQPQIFGPYSYVVAKRLNG